MTTPNPNPPPPPQTWLDKIGGKFTVIGSIIAVIAASLASLGGGATATFDWFAGISQMRTQLTTMTDQVNLQATAEKEHVKEAIADRAKLEETARILREQISRADEAGRKDEDTESRLRQAENKIAELTGFITGSTNGKIGKHR